MSKWFALLFFLTMGMGHYGYSIEPLTVTDVKNEYVTFHGEECVFQTDNETNWRKGDKAEALIRDGKLLEVRWVR